MKLGKRSTAKEALQGADLSGKVAVVTGGNSGIGAETVRALASAGARVILTSRDPEKGREVAERLAVEESPLKGKIEVQQLDLSDLVSVQTLANQLADEKRIDYLILNAGVMACPRGFTKDGFELQTGTNHFGHAALTLPLLPKLKAQAFPSRIVVLSSAAHMFQRGPLDFDDLDFSRRKYSPNKAYAQSKLCNLLFAKQLATQLKGSKVSAFSVHPGVVTTPLWRHSSCLGGVFALLSRAAIFGVKTAPQGAATTVWAAVSADLEGKSGLYLADCHEVTPSKQGRDSAQASRLWAVTDMQLAKARTARASLKGSLTKGTQTAVQNAAAAK